VAEYYFANPDFVRLGEELGKRGHHVSVLTSIREVDKTEKVRNMAIMEVNPIVTLHRLPHTLTFPTSLIYRTIKQQNIEIIHLLNDLSTNAALASFVSKLVDVPYVYTIQGPGTRLGHPLVDTVISTYHWTVERWIVSGAKTVILLSESLKPSAQELGVEDARIVVVHSGIDPEHFDPHQDKVKNKTQRLREHLGIGDALVLGYLGRLASVKGLDVFLSAVAHIQDEGRGVVALIVGDGAIRNSLQELANRLKVKTVFTGWQQDTLPYYSLMDVFVLPSYSEGLANVLLEAMAMEKAVVATNVGGNPDIVSNGENGFLVPAGDSENMAWALAQLMKDDDLRARIGTWNRQKVERHFSWAASIEKVERLYNQAL